MKEKVMKFLGFGGVPTEDGGTRLSLRNFFMFPLGTVGRDFLYNLFNGYLLAFVLFTKNLTDAQFASITAIIIAARIFDAFNDPIMGGIVENTRSKWGRYKPWQLIGALLTGLVIIMVFCIPVDGWAFIGMLAAAYLLFSITFTMNDISYWGMMPSLTTHGDDRNKLTSFAQICAGAGGGLVGLVVPMFTAGALSFVGAVNAYRILAIVSVVLMVGFQMFSIFGVKEKPLDTKLKKEEALKLKDIFRTIFKNDQLLISALVLLILSIGTGVVTGGLSMSYFYFEFGYEGGWFTTVGIGGAVTSIAFTLLYPWLSKKFGRDKLLYFTLYSIIIGYAILLVFGLCFSAGDYLSTNWWIKFVVMFIINAVTGFGGGYYMIMIINIANTIEYNEWKHGRRDEGLIFSLRPFTAKMGSALQQGLVSAVYLIAGVLTFTNQISSIENGVSKGTIDAEMKNALIAEVTSSVPEESKMILLACMCAIPMVFALVALIIYKKKFYLSESTLDRMMAEIKERNRLMAISDGDVAEQVAFEDAKQ
jgi:melibiose permease/lactose/raffinose/galactose permease